MPGQGSGVVAQGCYTVVWQDFFLQSVEEEGQHLFAGIVLREFLDKSAKTIRKLAHRLIGLLAEIAEFLVLNEALVRMVEVAQELLLCY